GAPPPLGADQPSLRSAAAPAAAAAGAQAAGSVGVRSQQQHPPQQQQHQPPQAEPSPRSPEQVSGVPAPPAVQPRSAASAARAPAGAGKVAPGSSKGDLALALLRATSPPGTRFTAADIKSRLARDIARIFDGSKEPLKTLNNYLTTKWPQRK